MTTSNFDQSLQREPIVNWKLKIGNDSEHQEA